MEKQHILVNHHDKYKPVKTEEPSIFLPHKTCDLRPYASPCADQQNHALHDSQEYPALPHPTYNHQIRINRYLDSITFTALNQTINVKRSSGKQKHIYILRKNSHVRQVVKSSICSKHEFPSLRSVQSKGSRWEWSNISRPCLYKGKWIDSAVKRATWQVSV